MKIKVWVVTTCIPEIGQTTPCFPSVFGTEAEAEACADEMLRNEWSCHVDWNDGIEQKPYPGEWRETNDLIARDHPDGSWGEYQITSHEIEIGGGLSGDANYLDRFPAEARTYADRAYQDGYEDGANSGRDEIGGAVTAAIDEAVTDAIKGIGDMRGISADEEADAIGDGLVDQIKVLERIRAVAGGAE